MARCKNRRTAAGGANSKSRVAAIADRYPQVSPALDGTIVKDWAGIETSVYSTSFWAAKIQDYRIDEAGGGFVRV